MSTYINYPPAGSGGGITTYANLAAFPVTATDGDLGEALDTHNIYVWTGAAWVLVAGPGAALALGNLDAAAADAKGAHLTGGVLTMQSADATHAGLINTTTQSFAGAKEFKKALTITGSADETQLHIQNNGTQTTNPLEIWQGFSQMLTIGPTGAIDSQGHIYAGGGAAMSAALFRGQTAAMATTGIYNLGNGEKLAFRNILNNGDKTLTLDSSNIFQFDANVQAATFIGALSGNATTATTATSAGSATTATTATNATNVATTTKSDNVNYFPLFAAANSSSNQGVDVGPLVYNPSTNTLTATTFAGNASTATTATNATNMATVSVSNSASYFPIFAASSSNSNQPHNLGTGLTFNPSTNNLSTTTFTGALTGNASTASSAAVLTTARALNGVNFDGSGAITVPGLFAYTAQTTTYSAVINDYVNCTSGTFTVTLPTAVGAAGRSIKIKNTGTGVITIATTSSQTIDGYATNVVQLATTKDSIEVVSDGANWEALSWNISVSASYANTAGTTVTTGFTTMPFATKYWDTHSAFVTDTFTAIYTGKYRVSAQLTSAPVSLATTGYFVGQVVQAGSTSVTKLIGATVGSGGSANYSVAGSATLNLVAGDTVIIQLISATGTTLSTTTGYNHFELERVGN